MFLLGLQLSTPKVEGQVKKFNLASHGVPELHAQRFHKRPSKILLAWPFMELLSFVFKGSIRV
jgi:hypothetical protein